MRNFKREAGLAMVLMVLMAISSMSPFAPDANSDHAANNSEIGQDDSQNSAVNLPSSAG